MVAGQQLGGAGGECRPAFKIGRVGAAAVIRSRVHAETVAHGFDVFRTAKQADTVVAVLTLQAMLFEQLTKLTHMLRVYIAIRAHAPFGTHVVNREFHRHQTKGFSAFLDAPRLGQCTSRWRRFRANPARRLLACGGPLGRHVEGFFSREKRSEKEKWNFCKRNRPWGVALITRRTREPSF